MDENKNEFVRETIKSKPKNRKRIIIRLLHAILLGVVMAVVFCAVVALILPRWLEKKGLNLTLLTPTTETQDDTETDNSESETSNDTDTETEALDTEDETEPIEPETETDTISPIEAEPKPYSVEDYQEVLNTLYGIGKTANKSIVVINTVTSDTDWFNNSYERSGQGSGVIIREDDAQYLILTEEKIIANAEKLSVTFPTDLSAEVQVVGVDDNTGLAVLSVSKEMLDAATIASVSVISMGDSDLVSPGSIVIAVGSPLGTAYSVLTGYLTSGDNTISTLDFNYKIFTTDIVSNSSGSGILINLRGEMIGIIKQEFNNSEDEDTITAIPVSEVETIIGHLCEGEQLPYLGLTISTVTDKIARDYNLPKGVYIMQTALDSPGMQVGLQAGDVIVAIDGDAIYSAEAYSKILLSHAPGDVISLTIMRQGTEEFVELTYDLAIGKK